MACGAKRTTYRRYRLRRADVVVLAATAALVLLNIPLAAIACAAIHLLPHPAAARDVVGIPALRCAYAAAGDAFPSRVVAMARLGNLEIGRATTSSTAPIVRIRDFSFAYAGRENEPVLDGISLDVAPGAFCVVTGPTGCGKTTLFRCLKPELAPAGIKRGSIEVLGCELAGDGAAPAAPSGGMDPRQSATDIGFVMQDPAAQIVCDTVWHELAFGLESIGMRQDEMRRRIAEVAHFFGIEPILHTSTDALSGGQQQLVNLAAVLALRPRLIILDEPTAQLDPNARRQFLFLLSRVNRELGITVIMSTHLPRLPARMPRRSWNWEIPLPPLSAPSSLRCSHRAGQLGNSGAETLNTMRRTLRLPPVTCMFATTVPRRRSCAAQTSLSRAAASTRIVGGNGCGKSTLLKTLAGILRPQRGQVENRCAERQAYLPQDPQDAARVRHRGRRAGRMAGARWLQRR